jgi:riboflavin biosynthesis pyrimidine reductase
MWRQEGNDDKSGGARLIQRYLVDEIWLHIAPVLLGAGTRLFDHIGECVACGGWTSCTSSRRRRQRTSTAACARTGR